MDFESIISIVVIVGIIGWILCNCSKSKKEKFQNEVDIKNFSQDIDISGVEYVIYKEGEEVDFSKISKKNRILFALYGSTQKAQTNVFHVTTVVRNAYNDYKDKQKILKVNNSNLGGPDGEDPSTGNKKYLRIWYIPDSTYPAPV